MEQLAFTALLNRLFGAPVLALLQALHIHPKHPATPISNSFAMELLVVLLLTIFFIAVRTHLSVERPGGLQHTMEGIFGFVSNMADEVIGHHSQKYVPYLITLGMFILCCNLIGLVPGLESPTAVPIVPLGCALLTWVYYHYQGVLANGPVGYLKHFIGPQDKEMPLVMRLFLPFLLFPIEIFSHTARIMSLTIRLFANMFADEKVADTIAHLFAPYTYFLVPVALMPLGVFVCLVQTFVFLLLVSDVIPNRDLIAIHC